jgi:hypothetical protein
VTLPELLAELARHDVSVRFVPCDGEEWFALHIDGERAGDWARVPDDIRKPG